MRLEPDREYTDGDDAAELASEFGLVPDPWQLDVLRAWLGRDSRDRLTATTCGVAVPRQNGKNAVLEMRELYGLVVLGERILHTAHEVRTAAMAFKRLREFFEDDTRPEYRQMVGFIRRANGQEAVELVNGGEIRFSARSRGASRGFSTDLVVFDEAQELTDEQAEATLSTMAAAPSGNRQLIYTGTPPGPSSPGTVFARTRELVLDRGAKRTSWHEWGVDEVGDVADRDRWYATNPAMGYRLTEEFTETELQTLTAEGFARERLGWWSPTSSRAAIPKAAWDACLTQDPPSGGTVSYGVKISPEGETALAACAKADGLPPHVELVEVRVGGGLTWAAELLAARADRAASIVIDGKSGAETLQAACIAEGVPARAVRICTSKDMIAAATRMANAISEYNVTHFGQEELDDSALHAAKRPIGADGGYGWGPADPEADVTPFEAATLAHWGAVTTRRRPGRRARIL